MKVKIYPSKAHGFIHTNVSKSDAHRALICAGLSEGISYVRFRGSNKDIEATISTLRALGAHLEVKEDEVIVQGVDPTKTKGCEVFCNESGSTLRFMIPVFALSNQQFSFTGKGRLMSRPQDVYEKFFELNHLEFIHKDEKITLQGPIKAGEYYLDGSISSQFFTGLLFALPLCDGDSVIHISDPFESQSYIHMTLKVLKAFGVQASLVDHDLFIKGNQKYQPTDYTVEGDYSSAAFFALLGAINGEVEMDNLKEDSLQGDKVFFDFISKAGARVEKTQTGYKVSHNQLGYIEADLANCPDLGPVTMVLGGVSGKGMKLMNTARLRYKESDRVLAMKQELLKFGYRMDDRENEVIMLKEGLPVEDEIIMVDSHNDHRIAMAMAVLATISNRPVMINQAESVGKSYPQFFEDLKKVHVNLEVIDD